MSGDTEPSFGQQAEQESLCDEQEGPDGPVVLSPEEQRIQWVKALKAGDTVAAHTYGRCGVEGDYDKRTVARVTPTGRIRLDDNTQFDADGTRRTGGTWGETYRLVPWTEDIEKYLARRLLAAQVRRYLDMNAVDREKLDAASDEDLRSLRDTLRKYRVERNGLRRTT
jgi:hypothetical protein